MYKHNFQGRQMLFKDFLLTATVVTALQILFIYTYLKKTNRVKNIKILICSTVFLALQITITFIEIPKESGILAQDIPSLKTILLVGLAIAHYSFVREEII